MKRSLESGIETDNTLGDYKQDFMREQDQANLLVLEIFAVIMVVTGIGLIFITNWPRPANLYNPGYIYRNYLYIVVIIVEALFLVLFRLTRSKSPHQAIRFNGLLILDLLFLLCWAAAMSSVDQLIHGDIAVYIMTCFAAAASTRFTPRKYFLVYGVSLLIFLWGVTYFQADHNRLIANYINGSIQVIMALAVTLILYRIRVREFLNRKTVEQQKAEMEIRVQERTADLALANKELKAEIAERKAAEEKMIYLSLHDPLTGLYNRTFFEEEMRRLENEGIGNIGLVMCDVDGLKLINDSMGHDQGDRLLITTADLIKGCFQGMEIVARVGGDEFSVLLPQTSKEELEAVCIRLQQRAEKMNQAGNGVPLSLSIGTALRKDPSVSLSEVYKEADNNMYREKLHRSRSTRSAIVQTLMKALEARDYITEGHAERLQDLVGDLGVAIGLSSRNIVDLRLLAQFHDIGKVGIPDRILFKPGPLTQEEKTEMQRHAEIGHRIALSSPDLIHIADWVLKHHEWWNGQGYPLGLAGKAIPLECRILAIADAYDAMTSDRPYRKAMSHTEAIKELKRCAGAQFDPTLVSKFADILHSGQLQQGEAGFQESVST